MPRFRAVVQYPAGTTGKPFQIFGEDRGPMEEWCRSRARKEPDGTAQPDGTEGVIFETVERPVFKTRKRTDLNGEPTVDDSPLPRPGICNPCAKGRHADCYGDGRYTRCDCSCHGQGD